MLNKSPGSRPISPQALHRRFIVAGSLLTLLLAIGCGGNGGPDRGSVQGQVKLDGKPIENGSITFMPAAGTSGPTAGGTIENGSYSIAAEKGPAVGKYRVEIRANEKTGKQVPAGSPLPPGTMIDELKEIVPAKYNTSSELEREITAGDNTLDFELRSK